MTIRVLVADDQGMVRSGFSILLNAQADIEVVGEAVNGQEAIARAAELGPDVILMDVRMPVMDGLQATRQIAESRCCVPGTDKRPGRGRSAPVPSEEETSLHRTRDAANGHVRRARCLPAGSGRWPRRLDRPRLVSKSSTLREPISPLRPSSISGSITFSSADNVGMRLND